MYPKDTITKKQMDRVSDRMDARTDHLRDRVRRLTADVRILQTQMSRVGRLGLLRKIEEE